MKTALFLVLSLLTCWPLYAAEAPGPTIEIKCSGWVGSAKHTLNIRMTIEGRIVPYSRRRLVKASKKSLFEALTKPPTDYPSVRTFKSLNGYSLLRVSSSEAQITLGIAPKRKTGYFNYSDRTSGRGDLTVTLMCREAGPEGDTDL